MRYRIVNRWLSIRFNLISCGIIGAAGFVAVATPGISASLAGFALAFASTITHDVCSLIVLLHCVTNSSDTFSFCLL